MNILDLKRQLWALPGVRMPSESDGGNGSTGTSGASEGAPRSGSDGGGGGVQDAYNARQGFGVGLSADGLGPGTTIGDVANRIGMTEDAVREMFDQPSLFSVIADKIPGVLGIGLRAAAAAVGPSNIFGKDGVVSAPAASASVAGGGFNPQGDAGSHGGGVTATGSTGSTTTAAPSVTSLIADSFNSGAAGTAADSAWGDWDKQKTGLASQATTIGDRGDASYNSLFAMSQAPNTDLNALRSEVQKYGTQAYQDYNAGRAMAGVRQQSDAAMDSAKRDQMRMGVNPASGRMAAMGNQNAINSAAAIAAAGNNSRVNDQAIYAGGLNTVNSAANADKTQRMDLMTNANKLGTAGFSSAADLAKLGITAGTAASNAATAATNAGSSRIAANNGTLQVNNQQSQYEDSNDLLNLAGSALVGAGATAAGKWLFGG